MDNSQQLAPEQYEMVLKYMETTSEQNFDNATQTLKMHGFNLNAAVNARFGANSFNQPIRNQQEGERQDEEVIFQYIQFLKQKQQNSSLFFSIYGFFKGLVSGIFKGTFELIFPSFLKKKLLRSSFFNMYSQNIKTRFNDDSIQSLLTRSYQTRKPIFFVLCSVDHLNNSVVQLLNNNRIANKINQSFLFGGSLANDERLNVIEEQRIPPTVIVFRRNVFEKLQKIEKYVGDEEISKITVEQLNRLIQRNQNMTKRDRNVQIKYRNHIRRIQYGGYAGFYEEEEEELFPERARANSAMIKQQNEDYRRIEEENIKKIKQMRDEEEKKKKLIEEEEELINERKVRKMSIPDEPMEGQIVRITFRCPDGGTKSRNFLSQEKLQLIYNWVQTNEQIEFEDSRKRQFELLYSYPPISLQEKKDQPLKQVFDSNHEKVIINQL